MAVSLDLTAQLWVLFVLLSHRISWLVDKTISDVPLQKVGGKLHEPNSCILLAK